MTSKGWRRTCPDCGTRDGTKVEKIAFHPTFRCTVCGYVWDGSGAELLYLGKPGKPIEMSDDEPDRWINEILDAIGLPPAE